jgi:prophage tail gpP-like protein
MRGLFLVGDENGNVTITKASPIVFPYTLIQGVNIKRGRRVTGYRERFSEYTIKSQRAGDDTFFADNVGRGFYKTQDPQITRYRPLIIVSDGQGSSTELKTRGDWERNYRAGQSRKLAYDHPGFLSVTGQLFPINQLIAVQDDVDDFTGTLLIASVHYQLGFPGGEMTTLELADPATYDVLIPPKPRPKRSGGSLF